MFIDALKPGTQLQGGTYTIRQVLGQGATGITYLADMRHKVEGNLGGFATNVEVAIKEFYMKSECQRGATTMNVVIPNTKNNVQVEQYKESFVKEARKISGLSHPHIVHVLGVFKENDTIYYAMQYIRGGSIKDLMEKEGALPEQKALKFAYQVASAMDYMHVKKHMCHYDLKPGNIMIDSSDNAQIIDFGIAKNYDESGNETSTTPPGLTKGFAPLEQYSSISGFSPKSDVYSLGATLYSMLTNTTPPEPMAWINDAFTSCPQNVSQKTWEIVKKAMSLSTAGRPDMGTLKNEIGVILGLETPIVQTADNFVVADGDTIYRQPSQPDVDPSEDETIYVNRGSQTGQSEQPAPSYTANQNQTQYPNQNQNVVTSGPNYIPGQPQVNPGQQQNKGGGNKSTVIYIAIACATAFVMILLYGGYRVYKHYIVKPIDVVDKTNTIDGHVIYENGQVSMVYSGDFVDGQPNGKGVMVYKLDKDKDRYEGRFLKGLREDSAAVLYYRNGDVYRGSFIEDNFATGTYFVHESGEYFRGTFKNNEPWNGYWYDKNDKILEKVSH